MSPCAASDTPGIDTFDLALPHGIRLSCRAAGRPGAPLIVFLHGFPEAAFIWDELLAHFGARYRAVAPNLRGYECSSAPAEPEAYRAKALMADLVALIEALAPDGRAAAVVAHDWGGAVAWNLGIAQPQLLERLVMINSPHPGTFARELQRNPAQQAASAYMNFLARPDAAALLAENDFARLWPFFTNMGGEQWLTQALRERYRAVWRGDGSSEPGRGLVGPLNYYRATPLRPPSASDDAAQRVHLSDEQVTVHVPTTVLWGEADTALPPALLDGLERWVPRMDLIRVPGATHWILHEQPQAVIATIERALAG
ncbi:alpha/beta fold hydrolase [Caldimonas sp. KR1-144]|uniref:alpha/beta fold hydrolase n=1 Tax=Caldimonas sp. KR1-144 TaxID=3400911 RepID=UPI003C0A6D2E